MGEGGLPCTYEERERSECSKCLGKPGEGVPHALRRQSQRHCDRPQHTLKIFDHFIIREPQNAKSIRFEPFRSRRVIALLFRKPVLAAIEFNHQLSKQTKSTT